MEYLAWILLGLSFVVAALGIVLPGVPGSILVFLAACFHAAFVPDVLTWTTLVVLGLLALLSWLIDFFATAMGAKWGGASRMGLIGAVVGGAIGIFLGPVGLILGPFLGAVIGDLIAKRREMLQILRSGIGAALGFVISTVLRLFILLIMAVVVTIAIIV